MAKVRISVGNIADHYIVIETGQSFPLAILNSGAWKKEQLLFGAIGGAAELTAEGRTLLETRFNAREFHKSDARFIIDDQYLEPALSFFEIRDALFFETDPRREIVEELTTAEFPPVGQRVAIPPILSPQDAELIEIIYHRTRRQSPPQTGTGTSPLEQKDTPTRRLFHIFTMIGPQVILDKMLSSPAIITLTDTELASTQGGTCKGSTISGKAAIADNIGLR